MDQSQIELMVQQVAREREQSIAEANAQIRERIAYFNGKLDVLFHWLPDDETRQRVAAAAGIELTLPAPTEKVVGSG